MLLPFRQFVERQFGLVLLAAFAVGLFVPWLDRVPSESVVIILAVIIFLSSFRIRPTELRSISAAKLVTFYLLRFVLLPVVLWLLTRGWLGDYAIALFLLSMMPAGVSAPAFAAILGGNVSLALALVVMTTLLTPLLVPVLFFFFLSTGVGIDLRAIFLTLSVAVLFPIAFHVPFRRSRVITRWMSENGGFLSVLFISLTITLVIAKRRSIFFDHPADLLVPLLGAYALFVLYYAFGSLMRGSSLEDRISYSLCSGANNIALGISLALIYLPPTVAVFLVLCELPWATLLVPYRRWIKSIPG